MMKRFYIAALAVAAVLPMAAQETYENAKIATEDLNGTARYVGMGGAMEALGADISVMSTNPAGIGLFRKSSASFSFGLNNQEGAADFAGANKTRMSFDQAGFVYANTDIDFNIGFNFRKSRNFDYILSAAGALRGASQNKLTYAKAKNGLLFEENADGSPKPDHSYVTCNQLDYMYSDYMNYEAAENTWYYEEADEYSLNRHHRGYVGEYDVNLSGRVSNQVYLGMTIGIHDVNYRHYGEYAELLAGGDRLVVGDDREIDGVGLDLKAGIIFRPIETSPFRIGVSVATPTWYSLKSWNSTSLTRRGGYSFSTSQSETYDFKLYTPWKFGLSAGHTVGSVLALGLSYEYADYGSLDSRYNTGGYYDYWYDTYEAESESDLDMNRHTEKTLKGVSTLKVGAELKPVPELAIRLGYNYVSPMYQADGFKDGTIASEGSYYSTATDYTNWKATNRLTCGIGYNVGKLNLSAAYQYSTSKGEFSPFMNYVDDYTEADDIITNPVTVDNKRHQLLFTIGYTF